jgi:hypothetical protein
MAKRKEDGTFVPGVIYELGPVGPNWNPFYVGESHNPDCRINGHVSSTKHSQTDVYKHTRQLDAAGVPWEMRKVDSYGTEGPTDKEHDHIIKNIKAGHKLKNMKKGNQQWMAEMESAAKEMTDLNMTSYSGYKAHKKAIEDAERDRIREEKHKRWAIEHEAMRRKKLLKNASRIAKEMREDEIARQKQNDKIQRAKQTTAYQVSVGCKVSSDHAAQNLFNKGFYIAALNQLGGSHRRFEDEFGITITEAMRK